MRATGQGAPSARRQSRSIDIIPTPSRGGGIRRRRLAAVAARIRAALGSVLARRNVLPPSVHGSAPVAKPWGHYASVHRREGVQVKEIVVAPGGKLSLQRHRFRAEHWIVVSGDALVTCGHETRHVGEQTALVIPRGEVHRLANPGTAPLRIIEVQLGTYLGEDDITRLADDYGRL